MRSIINSNIANRKTNIRIIEKGVHITTVQNVYINYSQDYESLKRMIEISIRLSPQSPVYIVEEIKIYTIQGTNEILTQSELELFQSSMITRPEPGVNLPHTLGNTISLTVSVQTLDSSVSRSPPQSRSVSRSHARIARTERSTSRSASSSRNRDDAFENAKSPYRRDPSPRAPRIANPTPTRLRKGDMLPPSSVKNYNSDRRERKLADIEGIWNDTYNQDDINECRSSVNDHSVLTDKAAVVTSSSTVLAFVASPKGNVSFQTSSSEKKETSSSCEDKLLVGSSMKSKLDTIGIEPETIRGTSSFSEDENDDEEEEGYLTAEEGVSQIERTLQDLESSNETKDQTSFGENNEKRASAGQQALTTLSYDLSSCSQSITDITLDCAIVDGCSNMSYEWQDIYPETPERGIRVSNASTDNQTTLRSPSGLVKSPLKSPDRPSDAFKSANQAKRGSKATPAGTGTTTQPRSTKTTVYLAGNIPTTKKERAAAASTKKRIAAAAAAAQAAAVANHCYYANSSGGNPNPNRNSNSFQELSPGFSGLGQSSKSSNGDGRPSIGTITEQWEFMRINFVNNSDEELEWLMVSKRPGAYKHAHKKNQTAEDKYFKTLYDIDKLESRQQFLQRHGPKILAMNGDIAAEYTNHQCNKNSEVVTERLMALQKALRQYIDESPITAASSSISEALAGYSGNSQQMLKDLCMESEKPKMITLARKLNSILPTESTSVQTQLSTAKKESDEALRQMEKWAKRETETEDYAGVLRDEEMKWFHRELEQNTLALITMRTYIPANIAELSVNDLVAQSKTLDGLLSMELAQELKTNKLLHWVITHPDDIAFASFLTGDKKSYFENLEVLDIIELRAISICLPQKFELDNDGKKNEWRSRFMQRVRQLVSQQNREKIKGPWDEASGKRKMIELPPLKQDLERRPVYYYRTKEQSALKLKGYDDKFNLLQKKEGLLKKAEEEYAEAKKEYDTILLEMRDPDFKLEYGIEKLSAAKDLAKSELKEAETKRKNLTSDIARLRKTIADQPITRDQFYEMEQELTAFLAERGIDWTLPSQSATMIEGMFDPSPEIKKIERVAAKFSSAEEEAALRKKELTTLKQTTASRTDDCLSEETSFLCASFDSVSICNTESNCSDSTYVPAWRLSKDGYPTMSISASMSIDLSSGQDDVPVQSESEGDSNHVRHLCNSAVKVGGKRNSILASANQDMLSTLNKMFSPPSDAGGGFSSINLNSTMPLPQLGYMAGGRSVSASRSRTPSTFTRHGSVTALQSTVTTATVDDKPKEPKKSQSKLLKKLLEPDGGGEKGKKATSRPGLSSFLDQVKAAVHSDGAGCSSAVGGPPMSLLQQIQQAKKQKEEASKQQENKENAGGFANTGDVHKKSMSSTFSMGGGGGGAVSFLDAIKSRRVE